MSATKIILFSAEGLAALNRMPLDPAASCGFEIMSGGLYWTDELPRREMPGFTALVSFTYTALLAYRASLTLGEERDEFRHVWEQVESGAPNWPGLHPERRGKAARAKLRLAIREQKECLDRLGKGE